MNSLSATLQLLKTSVYFEGLGPAVLETIASRCRPKSLRGGELVFMEGDSCRDLYILESGQVKFYRVSMEGREQILKVFDRPGHTFCIPSAFSTGTHIVTGRAVTGTRLHLIDVDTANRLALAHPTLALKLVATAGEHMEYLVALAEDLSLKTVTARLAKLLHERAVVKRVQNGAEIQLRRDRLPEEELASMVGTVRVHISRSLMKLVRAGAIGLDRKMIRIIDLRLLEEISLGHHKPALQ